MLSRDDRINYEPAGGQEFGEKRATIEYNIDVAMRYGDQPPELLTQKFEETDTASTEHSYDDFARNLLVNWTPEKPQFEHEQSRGPVDRSYGVINLRYNGHRGEEDRPEHPELFLGFMGDADREPRGINTDPDMKELVKQSNARLRFHRFTPDHSEHITGGGRSEDQAIADNQTLFKWSRDKMKWFSRQIDGRRNGMFRVHDQKSRVAGVEGTDVYGEYVRDKAFTPQRSPAIICKRLVTDTREFRESTSEQDYVTAKYGGANRNRTTNKQLNLARDAEDSAEAYMNEEDASYAYKAAVLVMAQNVKEKERNIESARGDMDLASANPKLFAAKRAEEKRTKSMLKEILPEARFKSAKNTALMKTAGPSEKKSAVADLSSHLKPAQSYLNAQLMYKSANSNSDKSQINKKIVTNLSVAPLADKEGGARGENFAGGDIVKNRAGAKSDADMNNSAQTVKYKSKRSGVARARVENYDDDSHLSASDMSIIRSAEIRMQKSNRISDINLMTEFADNQKKERKSGGLGSKYTTRYIDRDSKVSDLSS